MTVLPLGAKCFSVSLLRRSVEETTKTTKEGNLNYSVEISLGLMSAGAAPLCCRKDHSTPTDSTRAERRCYKDTVYVRMLVSVDQPVVKDTGVRRNGNVHFQG